MIYNHLENNGLSTSKQIIRACLPSLVHTAAPRLAASKSKSFMIYSVLSSSGLSWMLPMTSQHCNSHDVLCISAMEEYGYTGALWS